MKRQFYFFGFAYLLKSIDFGVELYFWKQNQWFYVTLLDSIVMIFTDVIPITYVACVHNTTFKAILYAKLEYDLQTNIKRQEQSKQAAVSAFLGESQFSLHDGTLERSLAVATPGALMTSGYQEHMDSKRRDTD